MTSEKTKELDKMAETIALNLGLGCVIILAESNSVENYTTTEFQAGFGSLMSRISLARNYVIRQDTYTKRQAWDTTYESNDEQNNLEN